MIASHTRTHTHTRARAHTHQFKLDSQLVLYQNKIQWAKHQRALLCVTVGIRCSSAGSYQTALHCCGRPLLDWGWIACIRRKASCTEPRCLYRDGSIRIHVPCHPYQLSWKKPGNFSFDNMGPLITDVYFWPFFCVRNTMQGANSPCPHERHRLMWQSNH